MIRDRLRDRAEAALTPASSGSNFYPLAAQLLSGAGGGRAIDAVVGRRGCRARGFVGELGACGKLEEVLADSGVASSRDCDIAGFGRRTDHGRGVRQAGTTAQS